MWWSEEAGEPVMGRKVWGVPVVIQIDLDRVDVVVWLLTVTDIRAFMPTSSIVVDHLLAGSDDELGTAGAGKLIVTSAHVSFAFRHLPLTKTSHCEVFT